MYVNPLNLCFLSLRRKGPRLSLSTLALWCIPPCGCSCTGRRTESSRAAGKHIKHEENVTSQTGIPLKFNKKIKVCKTNVTECEKYIFLLSLSLY